MKRPDARMLGLLAASIALAATATAQERYPARPIRLVIPSVPASVHDVIGRVWAEKVKPQLGTISGASPHPKRQGECDERDPSTAAGSRQAWRAARAPLRGAALAPRQHHPRQRHRLGPAALALSQRPVR